jgi:two-component system chemotaxis response regulator CheY
MATILVVDDSASMKKMVSFTLQSAGHTVIDAENGAAALAITQRQPADLVLTDVNMPKMNGIELCSKLRQLPSYKFTPVLMLTTESGPEQKTAGKAAGATGWIVKPFNPDQLLKTVDKVLSK